VAKKDEKKALGDSSNKLSHNPFASLRGKLELPAGEAAPEGSEQTAVRQPEANKKRGRLVQRRETKHRGGKAVIVVSGFGALADCDRGAVEALAKELKAKLGCGGTVEQEQTGLVIVIQGDQAKKVAELLRERGFRVDGVVS
jgi:translation initiation factor 1 (eIF-1/SUI1)